MMRPSDYLKKGFDGKMPQFARVNPHQPYFFEHSLWIKPYVGGFYAKKYLGLELTQVEVEDRFDELLAIEQAV